MKNQARKIQLLNRLENMLKTEMEKQQIAIQNEDTKKRLGAYQ